MPLKGTFEGVLESSTNLCLGQTEFVTDRQIYCRGGYYRVPENNRVCVFLSCSSVVGGFLSDRLKRRKPLVIGSGLSHVIYEADVADTTTVQSINILLAV